MKLRRFLIILGALGIMAIILTTLGHPAKFIAAFRQVKWYVVPLVFLVQLSSYFCNSRYYQTFFRVFGNEVPLRSLYEISLGINFANQAIPSGGVSGTAFLAESAKPFGVPSGRATLAQLGRYCFTFLSFFAVMAFGFVMLFFGDDQNKISVRIVLFLMIILLTLGLILLTIFAERRRMEKFLSPIIKFINHMGYKFFRQTGPVVKPESYAEFLDDFYHGYHELLAKKRHWPAMLGWTLGGNLAEVATVYGVFLCFGLIINPGIVITGYALAIMAGAGAFLTSGLGIYEAGMIGTFSALGIPFALSIAVVLVYRIVNMGIFLPIGLFFYRKYLKTS
jgi:uncharacterized protein (TIRG00374 family)